MKKLVSSIMIILAVALVACGGDDYLNVEYVDDTQLPGGGGGGGGTGGGGTDGGDGTPHDLFGLEPGALVPLASYAGVVDPVGTNLSTDFDGDAIKNADETATNVWVADYPVVETNIATPVTMRIEVLNTSSQKSDTIGSEITNSDVTSSSDSSSEALHRNEINLRTTQFQDSFNTSTETSSSRSSSRSAGGGVSCGGFGVSGNRSRSSSVSTSYKSAYGETKTKWKDVPFKNNTNRKGWSMKRDDASRLSRAMRSEVRTKREEGYEIKANAGYVRAALYIDNASVNMPVRLRNILCSFMLETPEGQLLPVQSFRLRNDDYSIFEIELYGGSTFGPYVIELKGLNTAEIKDAIGKGYNPKIFIIDYEMTLVDDSNYRVVLNDNFTVDNLKIVEENAKGRTAGIKFVGPGMREFFRVSAFDTDGVESASGSVGAKFVSPGLPLEKALERITYSGVEIEYANYVLDFTGFNPPLDIVGPDGVHYGPKFMVKGIKRVGGIESKIPCTDDSPIVDDYGTTYVMKPLTEWTPEDFNNFKLWTVYSNGKYYLHDGDMRDGNGLKEYPYDGEMIPMTQGVRSTVWAGDHYDIVFLDLTEYYGLMREFGNNPLETNGVTEFTTRWSRDSFGEYPFDPDQGSTYLGEAAPGDMIEVKVKLKNTFWLKPDFGTPDTVTTTKIYKNFSYNWQKSTQLFDLEEAVDFEMSFGLGGEQSDWVNIIKAAERSPYSEYYSDRLTVEKTSWSFMEQEFTILLKIGQKIDGVAENGLVKLYLRSCPNNAYRESIWPLPFLETKKFRGVLLERSLKGSNKITVGYPAGEPVKHRLIEMRSITGVNEYIVENYTANDDKTVYEITLKEFLNEEHIKGEQTYIAFTFNELMKMKFRQQLKIAIDDGFFADWNADYGIVPPAEMPDNPDDYLQLATANDPASPSRFLGFNTDFVIGNWLGNNSYANPSWNRWSDGGLFKGFLDRVFYPFLQSTTGKAMRLLAGEKVSQQNDLLVSTTNGLNQYWPRTAVSNDYAFVVWYSDNGSGNTDIRGIVYDISGDMPVPAGGMNDMPVSFINASDQSLPHVAVEGNLAFVVWISRDNGVNDDIRGRLFDISSGTPVPVDGMEDILISTGPTGDQREPRVAMAGGRAVVVWHSNESGDFNIRGRVYDVSSGSLVPLNGNDFLVNTITAGEQGCPNVALTGSTAMVVWHTNPGSGDYDIRGILYDISGTTPTPLNGMGDVTISTSNAGIQGRPDIVIAENRAFVVWHSDATGANTDWNVQGRLLDLSLGQPNPITGLNDFIVSTSNASNQMYPSVTLWNNKAFVTWISWDLEVNGDIRGRIVDITGSQGDNDFMINTSTYQAQHWPSSAITEGGRAFVVWHSYQNNADWNIHGRLVDVLGNTGNVLPYGLNHFMVSPLVERFYDVQVRIVE